ncbi:MAG: DEAD/DEAH box helicase, partial [Oscillospiraceae bacterium]|nr:DEAD/DEAH box helicase [Oscillospiraceae bacterium]
MDNNPLSQFHTPASDWFARALGEPTPVQAAAWPVIASGGHTLVSAPTGTGKTLSAFFVFLDRLKAEARAGTLTEELRLIYVSPLKSLAGDIRENLRRPLDGISQTERRLGAASPDCPFDISAAVRTGDTTAAERRRMIKHPPHILITTPESLYLLLTSVSGQKLLKTARAVILDELHALINTKRGAHLMLSLARLDTLCGKPLQRIGLSATIRPLSLAAEYLSPEPVTIAAPDAQKTVELTVISPFPKGGVLPQGTIWPELARAVLEACSGARTAIAFTEGRMHAEKLAYYVNELAGEDFARTHHGSVSKDRRAETENALRAGTLRLLCATSSMELGIDVGAIDVVLQIGCPRGVSSALQRLGRAGHTPGGVSVMKIFPRTASEGLYCGLTARAARDGGIEPARPPELCLDILAQHLVSMTVCGAYTVDDVTAL